ncbi:FAEL228Wp [Eremothecium gossypii FDAG1]|nr:FAEL228Wp [Eremothecium gossypii FDAG1]
MRLMEMSTAVTTNNGMNRLEKDNFMRIHLQHKYTLLHHLSSADVTHLSGLYLKSFYNAVKRNRVVLPNIICDGDVKFCGSCGIVYVAGVNLQAHVQETSQEDGIVKKELVYKCLKCSHEKRFVLSQSDPPVPKTPFVAKWPSKENSKSSIAKSSGRERAKKRKKNMLSNLLAAKKQHESTKGKVSLQLEDFMKS